jgi:1-acyl-sn-glycerol-3-phosphate acyltransferase
LEGLEECTAVPPKYLRRLLSIPVIALFGAVLLMGLPLWLTATLLADAVLNLRRLRCTRILLFLLFVPWLEMLAVLRAFALWVRHFGQMRNPAAQNSLQTLLSFYGHSLTSATKMLLGLRVSVTGLESVDDGAPLLCFGHHTSLLDSFLPVEVLGHERQYRMHYVIKKSLAYAPAFDIVGHWIPVHFVDRSGKNSEQETRAVGQLAANLPLRSAQVIYPEGTFYTPARHARALERLATQDPELMERAKRLRYVLPPRAGGALSMLEHNQSADVLFFVHAGFEPFENIGHILRNVPFTETVRVHMWRVPRAEIPTEPRAQYRWLFGEFERMEHWVASQLDATNPLLVVDENQLLADENQQPSFGKTNGQTNGQTNVEPHIDLRQPDHSEHSEQLEEAH